MPAQLPSQHPPPIIPTPEVEIKHIHDLFLFLDNYDHAGLPFYAAMLVWLRALYPVWIRGHVVVGREVNVFAVVGIGDSVEVVEGIEGKGPQGWERGREVRGSEAWVCVFEESG
jgi:hypothetical protein